jgi:adenylate cyclase, class 2
MQSPVETEVKIRIDDAEAMSEAIERAGFVMSQPREFEVNTLYDTPLRKLVAQRMVLRLRTSGTKQVVTWKGPTEAGPHKRRPEIETTVGSVETMAKIFAELGYEPSFRYEKYRREFRLASERVYPPGVITVDETPIGAFMELEGPGEWIDATAKKLGFGPANYMLESYIRLYLNDCEQRGVAPGFMVFTDGPA